MNIIQRHAIIQEDRAIDKHPRQYHYKHRSAAIEGRHNGTMIAFNQQLKVGPGCTTTKPNSKDSMEMIMHI